MKKYLVIISLVFIVLAYLIWKPISITENEIKLSNPVHIPELEHGDIIMKNGKGLVSRKIVNTLAEDVPFSHIGIYYKTSDTAYVIHSVSGDSIKQDGVQAISLQDFIRDSKPESVCFVRRRVKQEYRYQFAEEVNKMAEQKLGFDMKFDISDSSKIYCEELAYWAFLRTGDSLELMKKSIGDVDVILFETFSNTEYFEILK